MQIPVEGMVFPAMGRYYEAQFANGDLTPLGYLSTCHTVYFCGWHWAQVWPGVFRSLQKPAGEKCSPSCSHKSVPSLNGRTSFMSMKPARPFVNEQEKARTLSQIPTPRPQLHRQPPSWTKTYAFDLNDARISSHLAPDFTKGLQHRSPL
eukprot:917979-Amphidinium_carterae.1